MGNSRSRGGLYFTEAFEIFPQATNVDTDVVEVRTFTITTKSSHAENITVTLDGEAIATIAVADETAGAIADTATDIAAGDYSGVGDGWTALASTNDVIFTSDTAGPKTGAYSISGTSAAAAGGGVQTTAGQENVSGDPVVRLYCGATGDIDVTVASGARMIFADVPTGDILPVGVIKIHATTTTATKLIALIGGE